MKREISDWFLDLQDDICSNLEVADNGGSFVEDKWERPGGGGGKTRIFKNGNIIERGGVNYSAVFGDVPDFLKKQFPGEKATTFYATGVSIVMHPKSPEIPIIHMNIRYFELGKIAWFGGGIDLTPHYVNQHDAVYFHSELKKMCDKHDQSFYPKFKTEADNYFFIKHRNETRGIGGIFFDHFRANENHSLTDIFSFVKSTGSLFAPLYVSLINLNKSTVYSENEKKWQLLRRGRYVEFNLVYDRGTKFGLDTNGRTESILMSLPPIASWEYDYQPEPGSREAETISFLKKDIDWLK